MQAQMVWWQVTHAVMRLTRMRAHPTLRRQPYPGGRTMPANPKPKKQLARLAGIGIFANYPIGRVDIEWQPVRANGETGSLTHTLQLIVSDHEAQQLATVFAELAKKLAELGGTKQ
jgi:hypothetical protein